MLPFLYPHLPLFPLKNHIFLGGQANIDIDNIRIVVLINYAERVLESGIVKKYMHVMDALTLNR